MTTLFLDFDGVLHPDQVYRDRKLGVVLRCDGHNLFEHTDMLAELLEPHPHVEIVLSTSWVHVFDFQRAKARLPESLQARVIGATYHKSMKEWFTELTRYRQINKYVHRHNVTDWIALDDDADGWPEDQMHRLVHTDEWKGIGDMASQQKLIEWLQRKEKDYGND
jgi:hypothetical protein